MTNAIMDKFIIVWLDSNFDDFNENTRNTIVKLENIINRVQTFTDAEQCFNFLRNITVEKIVMIISESFNQYLLLFLNLIEDINQICSVYIIDNHEQRFKQYKVKGVFIGIEDIIDTLKQDVHQYESNPASIDIDRLDPSYMYSKLLIEIILKIQYDEEAKKIFTSYCREQFINSNSHLKKVDEFDQYYNNYTPIWWYTKEVFIYSLLNRGLRLFDVDIIIKMGFFIQSLHRQIERLHSEAHYTDTITVYRGQGISHADFEKMRMSQDGLLSFNNFLSTCADRDISFMFAESSRDNPDLVGVVFRISSDPSISSVPFAAIDNLSDFLETGNEVLFSMHTVFRIDTVHELDDRLWEVHLTLTNETDPQLKSLMDCIRNEIITDNPLHSLALLLNKMGHFDKATEILETIPSATNYSNIGLMYQSTGEYSKALTCYEKTLENDQNSLPSNNIYMATTYNNIGTVHQSTGNLSSSLSYYEKALEIKQKTLPPNHPSLLITYNNLGDIYNSMGEYSKAFSFYERILKIQLISFPSNHPSLATTFNNIGSVQRSLGNYFIALLCYQKTLKIETHSLLSSHPSLTITYNNIGLMYSLMNDYSRAISYYEKALELAEKTRVSLAMIYNNIGEVYDSMENYSSALSYYEKALEIQQKTLPVNHPEIAAVYNNIGEVYRSMKNHTTAITYYEKTLEIEQNNFPSNHPSLAITYINMAVALEDLQRYTEAIQYTERAIEIYQHTFGINHSKTKEVQAYLDKLRKNN